MQWSEVIKPPKPRLLRQFAGLWLLFFAGLAGWRAWHGQPDVRAALLLGLALSIGLLGLAQPRGIRWIYTGWMIAAFPVGWTVSKVMVAAMFYLVFTPVALIFRLMKRDALHLRRPTVDSYWTPKEQPASVREYFRQS
jgi:hypothetical protein